ncbi:META domain-containing protein [Streptomyces sp. NPDC051940]|uniref:META domain-containing protein n=1 Tax=Streptomyces sp. NPDC051940 TaxID=3155675 RepID=UPI00342B6047
MTALVAAVVMGGALGACAGETDGGLLVDERGGAKDAGKSVLPLDGTPWLVQEVTAKGKTYKPPTDMIATFEIKDGQAGARACNRMGSPVTVTDDTVEFGVWESTAMACENGMDFETALAAALKGEVASALDPADPNRRILTAPDGSVVTLGYDNGSALLRTKWHAVEQPPMGGMWVRFTADGAVEGNTGCNTLRGTAKVHDTGTIDVGPLAVTLSACLGGGGDYERKLTKLLTGTVTVVENRAGKLTLKGGGGTVMEFTARP